ncbi:VIT1/CCC1 transporter family protein [Amycolatopsis aidingensis]|uniref:VIT1/CCC1 transporter family protein n=1 Tax=Amycolatopsis aidingensis TaxID=2842453 RepID=UPI001C0E8ADF|nr:VIT family protein [Amycolatopsis aidingensis]
MTDTPEPAHSDEAHHENFGSKLNSLRAGVLGANDGIVSVAGLVVGVAGATTDRMVILTAGIAGLVAGALSMAGGEYVSVSSQRDSERAMLRLERQELAMMPEAEERELAEIYQHKGLSPELAARVAQELTAKDALQAHAEAELRIDPDHLTSPWQAAWASLLAFAIGALLPLVAITLPSASARVWACGTAVVLSLALTGLVSGWLGRARIGRAIARNVGVGALTMVVTYLVGTLFGAAV